MRVDELKRTLRSVGAQKFCEDHLFNADCWIFDKSRSTLDLKGEYADFKDTISGLIGEKPKNIAIVGSAKYGVSMHPEKSFRAFNKRSDIDIVIISPTLFFEVWDAYREAYFNGYNWLNKIHSKSIFRRFVVIYSDERSEYKSIYLRSVWLKMENLRKEIALKHRISNSIKFRIYYSWEDAKNYHISGTKQLKEKIKDDAE